MKERIAIVGGTFDPIHNGHVVAATSARDHLGCDQTLVVVARDPWQKAADPVTSAAHRYAMAELACTNVDGLTVSDMEIRRGGPTFTVDTAHQLSQPDREIFLVLGADAVAGLESWSAAPQLAELVTIAALQRNGEEVAAPHNRWSVVTVPMPRLDISSTDIRTRVIEGRSIDGLVPPMVVDYIERTRLYR